MATFKPFADQIHKNWQAMCETGNLFQVDVSKDDIWDAYLNAFPEGTNPIFIERTEHDCQTCKNFIVNLGRLVSFKKEEGRTHILSPWSSREGIEYPYNVVAEHLAGIVESAAIESVFFTDEPVYGNMKNSSMDKDGRVYEWHHFYGTVPEFAYVGGGDVARVRGRANTNAQTIDRAAREIKLAAIDQVLELIDGNQLYRGSEYRHAVQALRDFKASGDRSWVHHSNHTLATVRNSAIGTLLVDLSTHVPLEEAVRKFETMVAPANYKRPTALITPGMIDKALKTLRELGLESAIERRFATISDVSVNDVLWASGMAQTEMRDSLRDALMSSHKVTRKPVDLSRATEIQIDEFLGTIAPKASELEIFLDNSQEANLMSLSAPVHADAEALFPWDNNFAWSYRGGVADSDIAQRVRRAGGKTDGKLRVSLAWYNSDDLDLHCTTPTGKHLYFGNRVGVLDVDMNIHGENPNDPVENMIFNDLTDGVYTFAVNNFTQRNYMRDCRPFEIEVATPRGVQRFSGGSYNECASGGKRIQYVQVKVENQEAIDVIVIHSRLTSNSAPRNVWGLRTQEFTPITTVMLSPNFWGQNKSGNKHYFFILDNCTNPEPIRGIYNEFLRHELHEHRKVFEVLGDKTRCLVTPNQLSGVGFSTTQTRSSDIIIRAGGQIYKVII